MPFPIANFTYGTYLYFAREIGGALGYGHDPASFNHEQNGIVDSYIQRGLNTFYYPPALPTDPNLPNHKPQTPHRWSFLYPTANINIVAGTDTYDLPDDCSGRLSEFSYVGSSNTAANRVYRIPIVTEQLLRQSKLQTNNTGNPVAATISVKARTADSPQKYEVIFFPNPTVAATLSFNYEVTPGDLNYEKRFPFGGRQHTETMLAAMLAIGEEKTQGAHGSKWGVFLDRLKASIQLDLDTVKTTAETIWPTDNLSTTLTVDYFEIQRQAGIVAGFGPNPFAWSAEQKSLVDQIIDGGLRQYYVPPPVDAQRQPHEWSFLRPAGQLVTDSGERIYPLPPDFERFNGPLTYADPTTHYSPISITSEGRLRSMETSTALTAFPRFAAVRPRNSDSSSPQEQELILHPTPDGPYTLTFQYHAMQRKLSATHPFPLGGDIHGEGVLLSCLAVAETMNGKAGPYSQRFMQRLISNIAADNRRGPEVLGYNGNPEHHFRHGRLGDRPYTPYCTNVTYNGQSWD